MGCCKGLYFLGKPVDLHVAAGDAIFGGAVNLVRQELRTHPAFCAGDSKGQGEKTDTARTEEQFSGLSPVRQVGA